MTLTKPGATNEEIWRRAIAAIAVAGIAGGVVAAPPSRAETRAADGGTPYDGLWSVSIRTQFGPCDPSYRYPARIVGGQVVQADNDFSYQISGAWCRAAPSR